MLYTVASRGADAILANHTPPPNVARNLAILSLAIYDAVNAVEQRYQPYLGKVKAGSETSAK